MLQMSIEEPVNTRPKTGQSTSGLTGIHSRTHELTSSGPNSKSSEFENWNRSKSPIEISV